MTPEYSGPPDFCSLEMIGLFESDTQAITNTIVNKIDIKKTLVFLSPDSVTGTSINSIPLATRCVSSIRLLDALIMHKVRWNGHNLARSSFHDRLLLLQLWFGL